MKPLAILATIAAILILACGDPPPTPTTEPWTPPPRPTPTLTPTPEPWTPPPRPTPTLIPHPTLTPPLTWDAIDEELLDTSNTWRKEHLFRLAAINSQWQEDINERYHGETVTAEGPYSHREPQRIHLQWSYFGLEFTVTCQVYPVLVENEAAFLDSIEHEKPIITVRGEFWYLPGDHHSFSTWYEKGGDQIKYADLKLDDDCEPIAVDGQPWPTPQPLSPLTDERTIREIERLYEQLKAVPREPDGTGAEGDRYWEALFKGIYFFHQYARGAWTVNEGMKRGQDP